MKSAWLRVVKRVGDSGFWRGAGRVHAALYRLTGGLVGHWTGPLQSLLLTTTGRRSGQRRTVPLTYMLDGDRYVLVASNGGTDRHPAWWLNLSADPRAQVQVGGQAYEVTASTADGEERARLWPRLKAMNPFYGWYEQTTSRRIPIVILRRAAPGQGRRLPR
jgi:deazaflavin-dependent oxidoreductase (nitroreductase family)